MNANHVHSDEQALRDGFAGLIAQTEPSFVHADHTALDAAARVGRVQALRRRGAQGLFGLVAVATIAGVTTTVTHASERHGQDATQAGPASLAATTSAASEVPAPGPVAAGVTTEQLTRLVSEVLRPASGTVMPEILHDAGSPTAQAVAQLPSGPLAIRAWVQQDGGNSVAAWAQSCALDNTNAEKVCTTLTKSTTRGVWSRTFPKQPGRASLTLAADLTDGTVLTVVVDNYAEVINKAGVPAGKALGPKWSAVGLSAQGTTDAVQAILGDELLDK